MTSTSRKLSIARKRARLLGVEAVAKEHRATPKALGIDTIRLSPKGIRIAQTRPKARKSQTCRRNRMVRRDRARASEQLIKYARKVDMSAKSFKHDFRFNMGELPIMIPATCNRCRQTITITLDFKPNFAPCKPITDPE